MPTEDRRIFFENDEVYKALYALCAQKQMPKPPPGHVRGVSEDEKDASKIYIHLENPAQEVPEKLEYSRDFFAAALMVMCRGLGIPIPKSGNKSFLIENGKAVLEIRVRL